MEILILLGLIIVNGLFVMSEIALVSARKPRLESMAEKGDKRAESALKLSHHPELFLSAAQIGITLIAILTGVYSGDKFGKQLAPSIEKIEILRPYANTVATTIVVILVTFLSIVFGELIPKRIGLIRAEKIGHCHSAEKCKGPPPSLFPIIHNDEYQHENVQGCPEHRVAEIGENEVENGIGPVTVELEKQPLIQVVQQIQKRH